MKGKTKLTHQHQEQAESLRDLQQQAPSHTKTETVEGVLRIDSEQNPVPDRVAERLQDSVDREHINPSPSWWKRIFGK